MKCRICGLELNHGETFCKNCGASNAIEGLEAKAFNDELNNLSHQKAIAKNPPKSENGFLIALEIVLVLIALAVVSYLVYSTLKSKGSRPTSDQITIVATNSYYVTYKNYRFVLNPDIKTKFYDDILELDTSNYKVRINHEDKANYDSVTIDIIKDAYLEYTTYNLTEPVLKTQNGNSYYLSNVDYNNIKSSLIVITDKNGGYWVLEIGEKPYEDYPSNEILEEILKIVGESKFIEEENKLNLVLDKIADKISLVQDINE